MIQQGRYQEAEVILRKIGKLNKLPLPEDFTLKPQDAVQSGITEEDDNGEVEHVSTIIDVLKNRTLRARWFISAYCW